MQDAGVVVVVVWAVAWK